MMITISLAEIVTNRNCCRDTKSTGRRMNAGNWIVGGVILASGLLVIGLCIPLLRGRVAPNPWYGFRFHSAYRSDRIWYEVNRYGARRLILWTLPQLAVALLCFFLPLEHPALLAALIVAPPLLLIPGIEAWRFARRQEDETTPTAHSQ